MSKTAFRPHHSSPSTHRSGMRPLIAVLAVLTLAAGYYRYRFETRKAAGPAPLIEQVQQQLRLAPVLAAEAALKANPGDPQLRLRLADACAGSGDPVGAALALVPPVA